MTTTDPSAQYLSTDETRYRPVLAGQSQSPTLKAIWQEVYAEDYPAEVDPFGFVTLSDLSRFAREVGVGPGKVLLDLGCGRGGPGLWVARERKCRLLGLDIVDEAVQQAAARSADFGLIGQAEFKQGSFTDTGLAAASADAAMSVDALWMVHNKVAALKEVSRVLKPGSRFVFTTWEVKPVNHAALLKRMGFQVLAREEPAQWQARQLAVYERILLQREQLTRELGESATQVLASEAQEAAARLAETPRLLFVTERV